MTAPDHRHGESRNSHDQHHSAHFPAAALPDADSAADRAFRDYFYSVRPQQWPAPPDPSHQDHQTHATHERIGVPSADVRSASIPSANSESGTADWVGAASTRGWSHRPGLALAVAFSLFVVSGLVLSRWITSPAASVPPNSQFAKERRPAQLPAALADGQQLLDRLKDD